MESVGVKKNIEIQENLIDFSVDVDKNFTMQVFENLISNAIKFSFPKSNIYVKMEEMANSIRIEVQDEGPGLTDSDKTKLFKKFQKLSAKPTGGEISTGLGLSIVKRYVDAMDAKIWCESKQGKGAKFIVEFNKAA